MGSNNRRQDPLILDYTAEGGTTFALIFSGLQEPVKRLLSQGMKRLFRGFYLMSKYSERKDNAYLKWGIYKPDFNLSKIENANHLSR